MSIEDGTGTLAAEALETMEKSLGQGVRRAEVVDVISKEFAGL